MNGDNQKGMFGKIKDIIGMGGRHDSVPDTSV